MPKIKVKIKKPIADQIIKEIKEMKPKTPYKKDYTVGQKILTRT